MLEPEMMDDPALDPGEHRHALDGLARLNRASRVARPLALRIRGLAASLGRAVRVVDVATGSGDVAITAARFARVPLELVLTDISDVALRAAGERAAGAGVAIETARLDVLSGAVPRGDLVMCSLFLHHLDEGGALEVLRNMRAAAGSAVWASDLRRGVWGNALAVSVPRVLTRSRVVHHDAVLSARAAWSIPELRDLAARAGLRGARIVPSFPARMTLEWRAS